MVPVNLEGNQLKKPKVRTISSRGRQAAQIVFKKVGFTNIIEKTSLSESNSEWQAQMSDSSESSSDSDDESDDDEEALGVKSKVGPRFANVSGSEAWYLKRINIKKN